MSLRYMPFFIVTHLGYNYARATAPSFRTLGKRNQKEVGEDMDIDHWIKMLEVIVQMLQVLIWPVLALVALLYLGKTLKTYLNDLGRDKNVSEVSAEAGT